ncbi:sugar ABC transporter substrate-binding protein [Actinomycetota bacterium Odt1-20B]
MRIRRHARTTAVLLAAVALAAAGCSSSGGKGSEDDGDGSAGGGKGVSTPRLKIAMVTHAGEGDSFWDIVRKGAQQAAGKDNVQFLYANDKEAKGQAQALQSYVDKKVDGIIVTLAKPEAMKEPLANAKKAGIPVITINSGGEFSARNGALSHIGQDESVAGEAVGRQLNEEKRKKAICVIHEQGNVSLEARCAGVKKTFDGTIENLNVEGTNAPASQSSISAKLQATKDIDAVVTLGAPIAEYALKAKQETGSKAQLATFDLNREVLDNLKSKKFAFAVDQQPYLQGYEAVDLLWLYKWNSNVLGGGKQVFTGPEIISADDTDRLQRLEKYTARGTR